MLGRCVGRLAIVPLVAVAASCATAPPTPPTERLEALTLVQRVEHLDARAREPSVVEHPSGALFVSGYGSDTPTLWKSLDGGASWSRVAVGSETDGAVGNSDVSLAVARDGTLYFAAMRYDREKNEGVQIAIGASRDVGATWTWRLLSRQRFDDRPWVAVAPDGTAHAIWNDGKGVSYSVSRDRGESWQARARVHDAGGSSHLAVGPRGELAVRVTPASASGNQFDEGVELLAVSRDGGETWTKHPLPGTREWVEWDDRPDTVPRWVEPIAWDAAGALYALWGDVGGVWLARSTDFGARWDTWRVSTTPRSFFPYLVAGAEGELAATWYSGLGDTLRWNAARIDLHGAGPPLVAIGASEPIECFTKEGKRDPCGEYTGLALLRDGAIGVATTIQNGKDQRLGFTWWRFGAKAGATP